METRFDRGARWVMVVALALLLADVAQLAYRFTLPTDGWYVITTDVDNASWRYQSNLAGAPSGLARDDVLLAVEHVALAGKATVQWAEPPAQWRAGESVTMQVQRGAQEIAVRVPVVHWTAAAVWRLQIEATVVTIAMLGNFLLLALAWFTFLRRPEVLAARALLMFATGMACASISTILPDGLSVFFDAPAFWLTSFFSYFIFAVVVAPSLFAFALFFPRPKQIVERHRPLLYLPVAMGAGIAVLALVMLAGIVNLPTSFFWFFALATLAASAAAIAHSAFTVRDAVGRAQLRWAGSGFVLGITLFALNFPASFYWVTEPLATLFFALGNLGALVIGLGVAIAILRYRLFDIDIIIRRTVTYALVTALLLIVFFGSVIALQLVFANIFPDLAESEIVTVLSTLAIAALFVPLRNRIQDAIDKRFNRKKYDAQQILQKFGETVRDETDLEKLTGELVNVVQETMQPTSVSLWLKKEERRKQNGN